MRVREHVLLSTDKITVSATAKLVCEREAFFREAVETLLVRYQQEFGSAACESFVEGLAGRNRQDVEWRIRPEDSCWNQVKKE